MPSGSPFRRVAVAVDGSPLAVAAVGLALAIVAPGGELVFLHAIDLDAVIGDTVTPYGGDPIIVLEALERDRAAIFAATAARAAAHHISSTTHPLAGAPADVISAFVRDERIDAVVLGTHARDGLVRFALGSTAESVLRAAGVPTFVISAHDLLPGEPILRRLLVAVDGSAPAGTAVEFAIALARQTGAGVVFAHVAEDAAKPEPSAVAAVDAAQDAASAAHVVAEIVALHGSPAHALVEAAATMRADLIAIGTHGRTGFSRWRLGSVAEAVIRAAAVPVMAVPPGAVFPALAIAASGPAAPTPS